MSKTYDKKYCEDFQNELTFQKIESIWKSYREAGNSIEGRIIKLNFKKVLNKFNYKNEAFLDKFFQRFKLDKYVQRQQIDLQDFVLGLSILTRVPFMEKVKYIFYLTDLDQDGCLSLQQIQTMIQRVQKIFSKQNSSAKVDSYSLLYDISHKRADRNYKQLLFLLKKNNPSLNTDQEGLITCDQFIQALKCSRDLFAQEKFLPLNLSLYEVLKNNVGQLSIKINQQAKLEFCEFRKQIYTILQNKSEKQINGIIRYPGKIEILRNNKVIDVLPTFEKNEKRLNKGVTKQKTQTNAKSIHNNDFKQLYDQKLAEQTLQSYKNKVKKMIQTKQDPRLNIQFDKQVRK